MKNTEKIHYLRNDNQTQCGRNVLKVKISPFIDDVNCSTCLNSLPVEITGSLDNIIKILQDKEYELDGIRPIYIKLIDGKLYLRRSRWMKWDKIKNNGENK